jgi:lipopolysaccharide biosynthesis glycosyltransferase
LHSIRKASEAGAAFVRSHVRPAVRRGLSQVEPLDRAATRLVERRRRAERLREMYEALRRSYLPVAVPSAGDELPSVADINAIQNVAVRASDTNAFFRMLTVDGDLDRAAVTLIRRMVTHDRGRARGISQALQNYEELRPIADICVALCAVHEPMPDTVWTLLSRTDLALVLRFAPREYFQYAYDHDPQTATESLTRALAGDVAITADAAAWLDIAFTAFSEGEEGLSAQALQRAEQELSEERNANRADGLRARIANLRAWHGRAARAAQAVELPAGEIPFALVDHKHPDRRKASRDLSEYVQSLAALGQLVRHDGLQFTGDRQLCTIAGRLRTAVPTVRRLSSPPASVRLYSIDQDATSYAEVPDATWTILSGRFMRTLAGERVDLPLNPRLRPFFIGARFEIDTLAAPGVVEYLRRYAPVGCLDWDTVFLLQAAGIPAFFSGEIASTVDTVVDPASGAGASGTVFLDVEADGAGTTKSQLTEAAVQRSLADNLSAAEAMLRDLRDAGGKVVTSDVRSYLSARALGQTVEYRQDDNKSLDTEGLIGISPADFAVMQQGIADKLGAALGAVFAGRSEDEVYAAWREACATDVAVAQERLHSVKGYPRLRFDLEKTCDAIRSAAVTVERSEPGPDGPEMNVEFSLDGNYKHQLDIVLDSVVAHASQPVRAFVLCRDHGPADHERMARLFPTVSFVWLPTDNVDYGLVLGMNGWVTPATMDRTLLPVLLGDLDRILHFDLDAMSLYDLAELYNVDMAGYAIAGAAEPQPRYLSGFKTFRRAADRLRRADEPGLARELIIRTHSKHTFDFDIFNAGIMVLDLVKMREDDFCHKYLPYVQEFGLNGQVVLNAYIGRERADVGGEWNRLMRLEMPQDPKIAHWAGPQKPWKPFFVAGRELWLEGEARFAARVERAQQEVAVPTT